MKIILDYIFIFGSKFNLFKILSGWKEVRYQHQSDLKNKDRDNGKTHLRKDKQNKMSPARNYPEEPAKTFFPPGIDESAAKKALKRKKKRNSKKNKTSKATPSGTSDKSEIQYSIFDISISEDSDDAVNIDTNENQLPDDPANDGEDDIMVSQDSEKSTTDEQIQDKDVNAADMEDVGSDNEYERQENYLCVQCMTYFWSKEELDEHEISTHLSYYPQEENFPDVSGNENIETDDDEANSCTKSSTDQASEENIAKDSSDEESKESVIIDLTSTKGEGISDIESNSGNDGNNSVNTFNGRDVSNDSVANETLHTEDCLEKLRHFLKLKYIKITLNSMSENACRIICREYIRDSPEYKIILTEFLFYNEHCMDILRNRYDSYVFFVVGRRIAAPTDRFSKASLGAIIKLFFNKWTFYSKSL